LDVNSKATTRAPREVGLTNSEDFGCAERLDYIIQLDIKNEEAASQMVIDISKTTIEPFFTDKAENGLHKLPFTQLSDHYGVSTVLNVKQ